MSAKMLEVWIPTLKVALKQAKKQMKEIYFLNEGEKKGT